MLEVKQLSAVYGQHPALDSIDLTVNKGEIVVILGANGAGKSTLLRAIAGICEGGVEGEITFAGRSLLGTEPDRIVERGLALVPEGRGIFGDLSVRENLLLGAYSERARAAEQENLARVLSLFPKLEERQSQIARTMSGGEQQMVAIGRAMMSAPDILMLDEPSLGLAPKLCSELFQSLAHIKALGIGILLVEQNAKQSLAIADRGYLLENTRITHQDSAANLARDPAVQQAYLGAGSSRHAQSSKNTGGEAPAPVTADHAIVTADFSQSVGEKRRSADQQIGGSIDDLVEKAAQTSVVSKPVTSGAVSSSAKPVLSGRQVERVMLDIEQAAKRARERANRRAAGRAGAERNQQQTQTRFIESSTTENPTSHSNQEPPVVIEVYRRPRVEVYRRRPSGEFERH